MPRIDEQIDAIEKKMAQHRNRLRDLKAQATKQERKDDARRKLLYGAAYLAGLETLSDDARRRSLARVEAHITRPNDRVFLGLPALPQDESVSEKTGNNSDETPGLPFGNS
ncbi:hypothetical protein PXK58_01980 [Phaeobacter gallaeciensis]|uniref:hypothetical protein n=1 Tax=Phaeobacter gallaeciensis TaxID=60890 RepID=UPI00238081C6|nr:hypothetical protein [Phaeobacter gallaeciensis]MDE4272741.1 hypothetical protein [Phaeobacter gallaeciensis]MDE4298306.1 hypothetical protein [Phaeobacter gallaeciensis]MDE5183494.1 hypothetical protein [Phaeobacter gallaeciensis]